MKRIITTLLVFILLMLLLFVSAGAESISDGRGQLRSISLQSYPDKTVYGAFEQLDTSGLSLLATYSDGSEKIITGDEVRISYLRDKCLRVGDDSVMLSYGGKSISLPVTVNRIAYDLSALAMGEFTTVYNGKYQSYDSLIPNIVGLDGIPLQIKATGGGVNAGRYDISIDFSTASKDYVIPESRVLSMTITPAAAGIVWENLSFVYDGKSKAPLAFYTDVNGARVYPGVTGAATNAGTGYTATVASNDPNYTFSNSSVNYEIKKADYDLSAVVWSKDSFVYDGTKKSISATGLPAGISVIGYTGERGTDAGRYTAEAILSWDERNYNQPDPLTHSWEIAKADYDMSGVEFKAESFVFDGEVHYPTLIGLMPTGADGIQLQYSYSAGASHVSDGKVAVIISFKTDSKNYNTPSDRHSSVSITPLGIEIEWGGTTLTYNGEAQLPEAHSEHCVIKVEGHKTTVGRYTATALTDNSDYYIKNDKIDFSIVKAENSWTELPATSTCFEGKDILIKGISRFGEVSYKFYSDPDGQNEISKPTACGSYYVRLSVRENENYSGLVSDIIPFEIVKIVPVTFLGAILRDDLRAFERIEPEDLICSVLNNDGSVEVIDPLLVKVIYENGESLRRSDRIVNLKYGEFTLAVAVEVGYADYDMSGVSWKNTEQTYDGNPKQPILTGLPEGVSIGEYLGGDMINAGSYRVYVRLDFDRENYNEPSFEPCEFVINKCPVSAPYIKTTYNGQSQMPISDSTLYSVVGEGYTSAGKYAIRATLTDPINYVFKESGSDIANAIFEILPATISIKIFDVELRLFEKLGNVDYEVTGGVVFADDYVGIISYADGGSVYVRSDNPNYVFDVEAGKIIRLPYPTTEGFFIILFIILIVFVLILITINLYRNRHRLATVGAMMKCRLHNRYFKADSPKPERAKKINKPIFSYDFKTKDEEEDIEQSDDEAPTETPKGEDDILEFEIDADKADELITDSLAKSLIKRDGEIIYSDGNKKAVLCIEEIAKAFSSGDRVDINALKEREMVSHDTAYLKVLGGGRLDKALSVYANEFSLSAVKMIALTGGQAIKIVTMKEKSDEEKE